MGKNKVKFESLERQSSGTLSTNGDTTASTSGETAAVSAKSSGSGVALAVQAVAFVKSSEEFLRSSLEQSVW